MGPWAETIERQGSPNIAGYSGSYGLAGLHMTATPGTVQRPTDWAVAGRSRGSVFKVTSTGSTRGIPSRLQLERIKRFLANSLLLELKIIQISTEEARPGGGAHGRITFTIQVRNRHRATETARELGE